MPRMKHEKKPGRKTWVLDKEKTAEVLRQRSLADLEARRGFLYMTASWGMRGAGVLSRMLVDQMEVFDVVVAEKREEARRQPTPSEPVPPEEQDPKVLVPDMNESEPPPVVVRAECAKVDFKL